MAASIHAATSEDLTISKVPLENDAENISHEENSNENVDVENIIQCSSFATADILDKILRRNFKMKIFTIETVIGMLTSRRLTLKKGIRHQKFLLLCKCQRKSCFRVTFIKQSAFFS